MGMQGSVAFIPGGLRAAYGTRVPAGLAVFIRIRPRRMQMGHDMIGHGLHVFKADVVAFKVPLTYPHPLY